MAQKIVSYNVAKALKEAGYPQGDKNSRNCDVYPLETHKDNWEPYTKEGVLSTRYKCETWRILKAIPYVVAPTYLDAWLWLWRNKKIRIEVDDMIYKIYDATEWVDNYGYHLMAMKYEPFNDPEEAIAKAIDCLVENKLLK